MPVTAAELQVKVTADTKDAESGLSGLGSKLGSVGGTLAKVFGGAALAGVAGLTAGVAASVSKFAEFEAQMNILKVTTGASEEQLAAMAATARALGSDMDLPATSSAGAATAMLELAKAGLDVDQTMAAAKGTLQLAAAAGIDEAKAAQLAAGALNAFGLDGTQATRVANELAYAANASALDATDLGQAVAQAGFIFKATGRPMEELLSSMIVLGNAGMSGSDGATALKNALMQASSPTQKAAAEMDKFGISLFDAQGNMKPVPDIIDHLNERLGGMTAETRNAALSTIFQSDGMKALIPLMAAGGEKLREYEGNLRTTNAAGEQAEARSRGLTGAIKGLESQWETLLETVGSKAAPGIEKAIRAIAEGLGTLAQMDFSFLGTAIETAVNVAQDALRRLRDAVLTVKQVFDGEWLPSSEIDPFVNAVGEAAIKVRDFATAAGDMASKVKEAGAVDGFGRAIQTVGREAGGTAERVGELGTAVGNLGNAFGSGESKSRDLANALKILGGAAEILTLAFANSLDGAQTLGTALIDVMAQVLAAGRAFGAIGKGDIPGFVAAMNDGRAASEHMTTVIGEFASRSMERSSAAWAAMTGSAQAGSAAVASATEAGMSQAAAATEAGMSMVEANTQLGMASAVTAVEAAAPQMQAAGAAAGQAAADGVSSAEGSAAAAGSGVGSSIGSGLASGISSWIGGVVAAARNLVASAIGAARAEAQAQSPSKKTQKLGEDMAEGLEIGLEKSELGDEMKRKIRDFIAATREYIPTGREIARVEEEIKRIRETGQRDALFRAKEMITVDSEILRLKQAQVSLERDLIPLRRDLARATRDVADIERGSLADRTGMIEMDAQRKELRLQMIELEKQLIGLESGSKRAEQIQKQIDKLRDQDQLLSLEADRIQTTNSLAATASRIRVEHLGEQERGQARVIESIKDQIDTLGAEREVFEANEAVIKNATENEVKYRERLIEVFKSEATPLTDRIEAGLRLIDQLKAEGKISDELAASLRAEADAALKAKGATAGVGTASQEAVSPMDAAAAAADRAAQEAYDLANAASRAEDEMSDLAKASAKYAREHGSLFDPRIDRRARGGPVTAGETYLVGERGPELFRPSRSGVIDPNLGHAPMTMYGDGGGGPTQTHHFIIREPDGQTLAEWHVIGKETAIRYGRLPSQGSGS